MSKFERVTPFLLASPWSAHFTTHTHTHAHARTRERILFVSAERFLSLIRALSINVSVVKLQFHTKTARNWQLPIGNSLTTPTATAAVVIVIVIMPQPQPQPQFNADVSIWVRRIVNQRMSLWRFQLSGKTSIELIEYCFSYLICIYLYYIYINMYLCYIHIYLWYIIILWDIFKLYL